MSKDINDREFGDEGCATKTINNSRPKGPTSAKSNKISHKKGGNKTMTENAIKYQQQQEDIRHNKEEERRKEKERKAEIGGKIGQGIGAVVGALNDASWYSLNKQMVNDSSNLSFNNPLGAPFEAEFQTKDSYPGILAIRLAHTLGDRTAIMHAAQNIYAFVRHANSGSRNYQQNDIIAYLLSMSDIYSFHAWMCRLYSLLNTAKGENRYYFNAMIQAVGGDPAIRSDIAQFRTYINSFATRANAYFVPKDLPIFQRRYWLYSNIFKDQPIKKSQEYVFVPYVLGQYNDTNSTLEAKTFIRAYNTNLSLATIISFGDAMLNALLNSADIGIMAGDILKAYGSSAMYLLPTINEDYHVESIYSAEVLSQIHNTIFVGEHFNTTTVNGLKAAESIYDILCPATGYIDQGAFETGVGGKSLIVDIDKVPAGQTFGSVSNTMGGTILNMYKDDVSPDDAMVATRLSLVCGDPVDGLVHKYYDAGATVNTNRQSNQALIKPVMVISSCGTEIAVTGTIYKLSPSNNNMVITNREIVTSFQFDLSTIPAANLSAAIWNNAVVQLYELYSYVKFDWIPYSRYIYIDAAGAVKLGHTNIDAANYCSVSEQTLKNMHYVAIQSLYGIPLLGSKVRSAR